MKSDYLYQVYKEKRERTQRRFPGSVIAGPARYPVERHNKAWNAVQKAYDSYEMQKSKEEAHERHEDNKQRMTEETQAMLSAIQSPLANAQIGAKARLYWTNCGSSYTAIVEIVKINARTFVIELVDDIPSNYVRGQRWPVEKMKQTLGNRLELLP